MQARLSFKASVHIVDRPFAHVIPASTFFLLAAKEQVHCTASCFSSHSFIPQCWQLDQTCATISLNKLKQHTQQFNVLSGRTRSQLALNWPFESSGRARSEFLSGPKVLPRALQLKSLKVKSRFERLPVRAAKPATLAQVQGCLHQHLKNVPWQKREIIYIDIVSAEM
jgi:hypothetical protein